MYYKGEHSSKSPLSCILLFLCLAVSSGFLFGSCTKDEPPEVQKPGKIVRSIRKAIPPPSEPEIEEKTEGQTQSEPDAESFSQEGLSEKGQETADTTQIITDTAQATDQ